MTAQTQQRLEAARRLGAYAAQQGEPSTVCPYDPAGPPGHHAAASAWLRAYLHWRPPAAGTVDYDEDDQEPAGIDTGEQGATSRSAVGAPDRGDAEQDASGEQTARPAVAHTGAMVALIPSDEDAVRLVVPGGEPVDELNVTLLYLGEAADIDQPARQAITEAVRRAAAGWPVVHADGFAVSVFNPGDDSGRDTCIVLGLSGDDLEHAHSAVADAVREAQSRPAGFTLPEQHAPWIPHITLIYTDRAGQVAELLDRVGPVLLDRVRVAVGDEVTDIALRPVDEEVQAS